MADFQDHFEDMDEEIGEFNEDLIERLEELFGFEFEVESIQQNPQQNRYYIHVDPVGAAEALSDELDADVQSHGSLGFKVNLS